MGQPWAKGHGELLQDVVEFPAETLVYPEIEDTVEEAIGGWQPYHNKFCPLRHTFPRDCIVDHSGHAGRPTGVVGRHHRYEHSGCYIWPAASCTVVFAQFQSLLFRRAPNSQIAVGHYNRTRKEDQTRQGEGVKHVCRVGWITHQ